MSNLKAKQLTLRNSEGLWRNLELILSKPTLLKPRDASKSYRIHSKAGFLSNLRSVVLIPWKLLMPFYRSLLLLTMKNLVLNLKILNLPLGLLSLVLSLLIFYALRKNVLSLKILLSLTKESIINL